MAIKVNFFCTYTFFFVPLQRNQFKHLKYETYFFIFTILVASGQYFCSCKSLTHYEVEINLQN